MLLLSHACKGSGQRGISVSWLWPPWCWGGPGGEAGGQAGEGRGRAAREGGRGGQGGEASRVLSSCSCAGERWGGDPAASCLRGVATQCDSCGDGTSGEQDRGRGRTSEFADNTESSTAVPICLGDMDRLDGWAEDRG